jgi:hypothetical protein
MMDFETWWREEFNPRYHKRISDTEALAGRTAIELEVEQGRIKETRRELYDYGKRFEDFKVKLIGNGTKGYIETVVDEAVEDLKKQITEMIKNTIREAFEDREKIVREKWDTRSWIILIFLIEQIIEAVLKYLGIIS